MRRKSAKRWVVDTAVGAVIGGILWAIVAVNFMIYAGIDRGYEATITEVSRQNTLVGLVAITLLIGCPVMGVILARRLRRQRGPSKMA